MSDLSSSGVAAGLGYPSIIEALNGQADTIQRMREGLIRAGRAAGCFLADNVSNEFLLLVPAEIEARLAALQTLPPSNKGDVR